MYNEFRLPCTAAHNMYHLCRARGEERGQRDSRQEEQREGGSNRRSAGTDRSREIKKVWDDDDVCIRRVNVSKCVSKTMFESRWKSQFNKATYS